MTEQPKEYIITTQKINIILNAVQGGAYREIHEVLRGLPIVSHSSFSTPPVPDSTRLIEMAKTEWKNREELRGIHNRGDWCCGWMAGFLSVDKPDWSKEHDHKIREEVLDLVEKCIFVLQLEREDGTIPTAWIIHEINTIRDTGQKKENELKLLSPISCPTSKKNKEEDICHACSGLDERSCMDVCPAWLDEHDKQLTKKVISDIKEELKKEDEHCDQVVWHFSQIMAIINK